MNVDEMVIASRSLMVGLEGCQAMAAKLFLLHLSFLFSTLSATFSSADSWKFSLSRQEDIPERNQTVFY